MESSGLDVVSGEPIKGIYHGIKKPPKRSLDQQIDPVLVRALKPVPEWPEVIPYIPPPIPPEPDLSQKYKADAGKTDPSLFDEGVPNAIAVVTRVLDYGAIKYEAHSWKKVPDALKRYHKAGKRHSKDQDKGEVFDPESGLVHLAHEICNKLFELELFIQAHPDIDFLTFKQPPLAHKS